MDSKTTKFLLLLLVLLVSSCEKLHWGLPQRSDHNFISFETIINSQEVIECLGIVYVDEGFTVIGTSQENDSENFDIILLHIDSLGNEVWQASYGDSDPDYASCLYASGGENGYVILGNKYLDNNDWQAYLIKSDHLGNKIWEKRYGWTKEDKASAVIETSTGGYLIAGYSYTWESAGLGREAVIFQATSDGTEQTRYHYGNRIENGKDLNDTGNEIIKSNDGNYLLLITKEDPVTKDKFNLHLLKLEKSNLSVIWDKKIIENCYPIKSSLISTLNGYAVLGALTASKLSLVHINEEGIKEWERSFNDSQCEQSASLCQASDSGYLILSSGMTLIKTDENGLEKARKDFDGIAIGNKCIVEARDLGYVFAGVYSEESSGRSVLRVKKIHPDFLE